MNSPEIQLVSKAANLFRGIEGVGGKLVVTNYRLIFSPHALNIQTDPETIPLSEIVSIQPANTLVIFPNQMIVKLRNGEERRFVVWGRNKLIELIRTQIPGIR